MWPSKSFGTTAPLIRHHWIGMLAITDGRCSPTTFVESHVVPSSFSKRVTFAYLHEGMGDLKNLFWKVIKVSFASFKCQQISLMGVRLSANVPSFCTLGTILLDLQEKCLAGIANQVLDQMVFEGQLKTDDRELVLRTLLLQHRYGLTTRWSGVSPVECYGVCLQTDMHQARENVVRRKVRSG